MIVYNLYLSRSLIGPPKDYAPLVVDPDGVKSRQIAPEAFKTVARRNGEVAEPARLVDLDEFSQRHAGYCRQTAAVPSSEQLLCVPVCEGLDQSGCPLAQLLVTSQSHPLEIVEVVPVGRLRYPRELRPALGSGMS